MTKFLRKKVFFIISTLTIIFGCLFMFFKTSPNVYAESTVSMTLSQMVKQTETAEIGDWWWFPNGTVDGYDLRFLGAGFNLTYGNETVAKKY